MNLIIRLVMLEVLLEGWSLRCLCLQATSTTGGLDGSMALDDCRGAWWWHITSHFNIG